MTAHTSVSSGYGKRNAGSRMPKDDMPAGRAVLPAASDQIHCLTDNAGVGTEAAAPECVADDR